MPTRADRDAFDDEAISLKCIPLSQLSEPVHVGQIGSGHAGTSTFFRWPILGALLFDNESSDARDHCANERTFLSYLRLSVYMAIVSVAITLSFHLKHEPTRLERHVAKPLGAVFWVLSLLTLLVGLGNYIRTVNLYSKRAAIVQTGWRTQSVLGVISAAIFVTCIILLVITRLQNNQRTSAETLEL